MKRSVLLILIIVCAASVSIAQDWTNAKPWTNDFGWLAYCPSDTTIVYGIERSGVLWKSEDAGFHWSEEPEVIPEDAGRARRLAFHPESPDTLFLLADHLYKSCDGGDSWTLVGDGVISGILDRFYYSPHDINECIIKTYSSIYKSNNGGNDWRVIYSGGEGSYDLMSVAITYDTAQEGRILLWDYELYESLDNGDSWQEYGELFCEDVEEMVMDHNSGYLYFYGYGTNYGWQVLGNDGNIVERMGQYSDDLSKMIGSGLWTNNKNVFAGIKLADGDSAVNGWHLVISEDKMNMWDIVTLDFPTGSINDFDPDQGCDPELGGAVIAINPKNYNSILIGTHAGAYHIDRATDNTILVENRASLGSIKAIISDPMHSEGYYLLHKPNGLWYWNGDCGNMDHKHAEYIHDIQRYSTGMPKVLIAGNAIRVYDIRSESDGTLVYRQSIAFNETAIMCPNNPRKLIIAQVDWYEDDAGTYVGVNRIGENTVVPTLQKHIVSLCASHDGESIYAGGDGMYVSGDEGETWDTIDEELKINKLVAHSEYSYVFILPEADQSVGLTKYNAHTGEMTEIADGLEGAEVRDLAVSGNRLYAATSGGVRISSDLGRSWEVLEVPFTSSPTSICLSASGNHLAIGTKDDGVWALDITDDVGEVVGNELVQEMKVYPNPFNSSTTVTIPSEMTGDVTMTLYNVLGEVVVKKEVAAKGSKQFVLSRESVDMARLSSGVYFLELTDGKKKHVKRINMMK